MDEKKRADPKLVHSILLVCALLFSRQALAQTFPLSTAIASKSAKKLGVYRNTYYYVVLESEYRGQPRDASIVDMQGKVLAQVSTAFKKAVDIEGTGRLVNGKLINYAGKVDGAIRYRFTDSKFGLGVGQCNLVPFRTIAVDPETIPIGSMVRIKQTIGMRLPGGQIHNGYWRAEDVGSAIKKDRVDLFVGDGDQGKILEAAQITKLSPLDIFLVTPPRPGNCTTKTNESDQN